MTVESVIEHLSEATQPATEPAETPAATDDPIAGTWDITCDLGTATGGPYENKTVTMVISGSNGSYVIETIAGETYNMSVTLDGNTLSSERYNGATLAFTYDASAKTLTQAGEFVTYELKAVKNIVATKQGGSEGGESDAIDNLVGTYKASVSASSGFPYAIQTEIVTITKVDATHVKLATMFGGVTFESAEFDPTAMTLTIPEGWTHSYAGPSPLQSIVFNVSSDYTTITCAESSLTVGGWMTVSDYKFTRQN